MDIERIDQQADRLRRAREAKGFKDAKAAATRFGWNYTTYSQHERGQSAITRAAGKYARAFNVSEGWLLTGEGAGPGGRRAVPLVGYVGAGAEVLPDFEQVPDDGLEQIEVPFDLPEEMIALGVRGDSMLPAYKDGAVIIVYKEQKRPIQSFYGEEAAVRTTDGRRFLKTIQRGDGNTVNLASWNASLIERVQLEWIGEIFTAFPPNALRRVANQGGIQGQLRLKTA